MYILARFIVGSSGAYTSVKRVYDVPEDGDVQQFFIGECINWFRMYGLKPISVDRFEGENLVFNFHDYENTIKLQLKEWQEIPATTYNVLKEYL